MLAIPALLLVRRARRDRRAVRSTRAVDGGRRSLVGGGGALSASARSSAGSRASSPGGCRAACATRARTRSATARRRSAYLLLVTDRYPNSDPTAILARARAAAAASGAARGRRARPAALARSRSFFRLPLAIPHLVWLVLWAVARVAVAVIVQWFVTLFRGAPAASLPPVPRARTSATRSTSYAFLSLAANPFPGFTGAPGSYPLDLDAAAARAAEPLEDRLPAVLAIPAVARERRARLGVLLAAAILTWFAALATGPAPRGLRNLVGLRAPLQRAAERVRLPAHRRVPAREPARGAPSLEPRRAGRRRGARAVHERREPRRRARGLAAVVVARGGLGARRLAALAVDRARRRCTCRT